MKLDRSPASWRVRLLWMDPVSYAQLVDEPSSSGAEAATAGVVDTATRAPDFTPVGSVTFFSRITSV